MTKILMRLTAQSDVKEVGTVCDCRGRGYGRLEVSGADPKLKAERPVQVQLVKDVLHDMRGGLDDTKVTCFRT